MIGNVDSAGSSGLIAGSSFDIQGMESIDTTIEYCYTSGNVKGTHSSGGIAGALSSLSHTTTISNCYSNADINSNRTSVNYVSAGGILGQGKNLNIINCASEGNVYSDNTAGGIICDIGASVGMTSLIDGCVFIGKVTSNDTDCAGGIIASYVEDTSIKASYDSTLNYDLDVVGEYYSATVNVLDVSSRLQVGVDSTDSSNIKFTTNMSLSAINSLRIGGMEGVKSLENIDAFISKLSEAQTRLGAIENRLTSTIESIGVNIENLTSSRSTLKDADVAKESSQMLKNQILQQASATLLATANQTPALALRLLGNM